MTIEKSQNITEKINPISMLDKFKLPPTKGSIKTEAKTTCAIEILMSEIFSNCILERCIHKV